MNFYEILGKEDGIKSLVSDFYQIMQNDPKAINCLNSHPGSLIKEDTKIKLIDFLTGWLGGPQVFITKYGHPAMRARHLAFKIGEIEKREWLYCMDQALINRLTTEQRFQLMTGFLSLANKIQNIT
jgi:hemoglobin